VGTFVALRAQRVQNLAYALIETGIQPGDRVVVVAPNCPMIAVRIRVHFRARGSIEEEACDWWTDYFV
jgi:acyl-CoA synthetase (AMP-forming)/AMP-acid ligase II